MAMSGAIKNKPVSYMSKTGQKQAVAPYAQVVRGPQTVQKNRDGISIISSTSSKVGGKQKNLSILNAL